MPADEVKSIQGHDCKLFRDGSPPVYLMPNGRFAAFHMGKWVIKASLAQLDGAMKRKPRALKLMSLDRPGGLFDKIRPEVIEVTEFLSGSGYKDAEGKRRYARGSDYFLFDPAIYAALNELDAERERMESAIREKWDKIMGPAREVYGGNFKDVLGGEVPFSIEEKWRRADDE